MNEIEARENYEWRELRRQVDQIGRCGNSIWLMVRNRFNIGWARSVIVEEARRLREEKLRENPYYPDPNPNVPTTPRPSSTGWDFSTNSRFEKPPFGAVTGRVSSSNPEYQKLPPGSNYQYGKNSEIYEKILDSVKHVEIKPKEQKKSNRPLGPVQLPLF